MKRSNAKLYNMILLALFSAIIIVMSFTPLGYLKIGIIEITFITIPVALGAILLGPIAGAFLGTVFGITSFIQCFGMSAFGVALLGINPIFTFITCMVPRIAIGFISGTISKALTKTPKFVNYTISSLACALLNTVLFVGLVMLFFYNTEYLTALRDGKNFFAFVVAFVGLNGLIEMLVTTIVAPSVATPLSIFLSKTRTEK